MVDEVKLLMEMWESWAVVRRKRKIIIKIMKIIMEKNAILVGLDELERNDLNFCIGYGPLLI